MPRTTGIVLPLVCELRAAPDAWPPALDEWVPDEIMAGVEALSPMGRRALWLTAVIGLSQREASEAMRVSYQRVSYLVNQATKRIQRLASPTKTARRS